MNPPRRLRLAPSLLSADFADLRSAIRAAESGGADAFHLDVMDGQFVPNISFGPALVGAVRASTKLPLDIHLMIVAPERYLEAFHRAGGDTLVFHVEATSEPEALIRTVHRLGAEVGAALRPETPFLAADRFVGDLDQIQVMGVHPGFSGQKFIPEVLPKIAEARARFAEVGHPWDVSVDGGVTLETAGRAAGAGATFFVCGNSVFGNGSVPDNLGKLRSAVEEGARGAVR